MNLVEYYVRKQFVFALEHFHGTNGKWLCSTDIQTFRTQMINHGCESVTARPTGSQIVWEFRIGRKVYMYRYNIPKQKATFEGVRNYVMA